jgi:itaconate CoA-transferase
LTQIRAPYDGVYAERLSTAAEAVRAIPDGATLSVGMAAGEPPALLEAIAERVRSGELAGLRLYYMNSFPALATTLLADEVLEQIDVRAMFLASRGRQIVTDQVYGDHKTLNFVPVNFSQVPRLFEESIDLDTFVVTVSPIDRGGYFSLGTGNDFASVAARRARRLLVEANANMPRVFGQSQIHVSEVDAIVEHDFALPEMPTPHPSQAAQAIGESVASLVPNGATIQLGIGRLPAAIAESLTEREDLGIHSELLSPALTALVARGAVTGRCKTRHPRKHVFTIAMGNREMYELMDDNSAFESYPVSYVNDIRVIADHDNFISVNTALEVDLYGQVNAEFLGGHEYSGSGGQFDFVKAASLSRGGKSIIALESTAAHGSLSTIVPKAGMVTDDRMDVEYVVTEHGIAHLRGKSTRERALGLIDIADPASRDQLLADARQMALV